MLLFFRVSVGAQTSDAKRALEIPDEVRLCAEKRPSLALDESINPFYIAGDFDGDGQTDFAAVVRAKQDQGEGIHEVLFCFANGKSVLWEAGASFGRDTATITGWMLIPRQSKHLSVYSDVRHDAIALLFGEEGGGLLYWTGRTFRWKTEE